MSGHVWNMYFINQKKKKAILDLFLSFYQYDKPNFLWMASHSLKTM